MSQFMGTLKTTLLLLSIAFLAACSTALTYQARPEFTPDGYSEQALGNRQYEVIYESYHKDADEALLTEYALRRAGEIAAKNYADYFDVIIKDFDFYISTVKVPEQVVKHTYNTNSGNPNFVGVGDVPTEAIIPAHFKEFLVKKITLIIELPEDTDAAATETQEDSDATSSTPMH